MAKKLLITVSRECNLRCSYCYEHGNRLTVPPIPVRLVSAFIRSHDISHINLAGNYETTLLSNFVDLYKAVCSPKYSTDLCSNGCGRPLDWWRKLFKLTPLHSQVNLQLAWHPEQGECGNLKEVMAIKAEWERIKPTRPDLIAVTVHVVFVMVERNIDRFVKYYKLYPDFVKQVIFKNDYLAVDKGQDEFERLVKIAEDRTGEKFDHFWLYYRKDTEACDAVFDSWVISVNDNGEYILSDITEDGVNTNERPLAALR